MNKAPRVIRTRYFGIEVYLDSPLGWEFAGTFSSYVEATEWAHDNADLFWRTP